MHLNLRKMCFQQSTEMIYVLHISTYLCRNARQNRLKLLKIVLLKSFHWLHVHAVAVHIILIYVITVNTLRIGIIFFFTIITSVRFLEMVRYFSPVSIFITVSVNVQVHVFLYPISLLLAFCSRPTHI